MSETKNKNPTIGSVELSRGGRSKIAAPAGVDPPHGPQSEWVEAFAKGGPVVRLNGPDHDRHEAVAGATLAIADDLLHLTADYRGAIQRWFAPLDLGACLAITVPRACSGDEGLAVPQPSGPGPRRQYSPGSLLAEVEEALSLDEFRVRLLCDVDGDPEVSAASGGARTARTTQLVLVLEKAVASWREPAALPKDRQEPADRDFVGRRTRFEVARRHPFGRILVLKLDHLGDFIMGLPALRKLRQRFVGHHISLVVGTWNAEMARTAMVADEVIVFDAFPRNSEEETVDLIGRTALFQQAVPGRYDLAIDLRTDPDTRFYLKRVDASLRAGIGTKAQFGFLDIFLPIDGTRHEPETARDDIIGHGEFQAQEFCTRTDNRIHCRSEYVSDRLGAVIWGPYWRLRPGQYAFTPFIDLDEDENGTADGVVLVDIALNTTRYAAKAISADSDRRMAFRVEEPDTLFEFRIHEPVDCRKVGFSFYGGRLIRQGADSVLHQSEYMLLLCELIKLRLNELGLLGEVEISR